MLFTVKLFTRITQPFDFFRFLSLCLFLSVCFPALIVSPVEFLRAPDKKAMPIPVGWRYYSNYDLVIRSTCNNLNNLK